MLAAAIEAEAHPSQGMDSGEAAAIPKTGIPITADLEAVAPNLDILIDFSLAPATAQHLEICAQSQTPMVIGTTGLSQPQRARMQEVAQRLPIVFASNYSIGVNIAFKLTEVAAGLFGDTADIEITETHHRHKLDAPSGTALTLGEQAAKALGRDLAEVAIHGRSGIAQERDRQTIAFHSLRGGDAIGEHTVAFLAQGERLQITHQAQSRQNFADGALRAAQWLLAQPPALYTMQDILAPP